MVQRNCRRPARESKGNLGNSAMTQITNSGRGDRGESQHQSLRATVGRRPRTEAGSSACPMAMERRLLMQVIQRAGL